jgi:two-component system, NarL family, nitrate/nitrite response regulator NarL
MSGDRTATRMNHVSPNRGKDRPGRFDAGLMTGEKVRVVVGDGHPLFRDGVVRAPLRVAPSRWWPKPTTGYRRSKRSGRIRRRWLHDESAIVFRALQEGAAGFLPKGVDQKRTDRGGAGLREGPRRRGAKPRRRPGGGDPQTGRTRMPVLSPREREVLKLIRRGQHSRHGQGALSGPVDRQDPRAAALRETRRRGTALRPSPRQCWSNVARRPNNSSTTSPRNQLPPRRFCGCHS